MASPPSNNPYETGACLPCCTSVDQSQRPQIIAPNTGHDTGNPDGIRPKLQTEDLLASEMSKLSVQERSDALYDVHCVGEDFKETPEMVQKSLADFDLAVQKLQRTNHRHRSIYEMAENQNRAYVEDPGFRLKFLRAFFYDIDTSVRNMMDFLYYKAKYFGIDKLTREIELSELTDDEIDVLLSMYHVQDGRDRMGRVIVHDIFNLKKDSNERVDTWIRATYYFMWNILTNIPDVQTKGIASVLHQVFKLHGIDFINEFVPFCNSVPVRLSALHIPHESSTGRINLGIFDGILGLMVKFMPQDAKVRVCIHLGSRLEIQYGLRRHGVPYGTFPLDEDGNIREDIRNVWFQKHLQETNQVFPNLWFDKHLQSDVAKADPLGDLADWNQLLSDGDGVGDALMQFDQLDDQSWSSIQNDSDVNRQFKSETGGSEKNEHAVSSFDFHSNDWKLAFPNPEPANPEPPKSPTTSKRLIKPTPKDVLLGRGRGIHQHAGNIRFREFLQDYQEEYNNAPRYERMKAPKELTRRLLEDGVRFLRMAENGLDWEEVDFSEAENKVKQLFRSRRKMKKSN